MTLVMTRRFPAEESRKLTLAVILSLLLHLAIILFITLLLGVNLPIAQPAPEEPMEITIIAPPVVVPEEPPYIATTESQRAEAPPDRPLFQSDKDTIAATEQPAHGDLALPTMEGRETDALQFQDQEFTLGPEPAESTPTRPMPEAMVAEAAPAVETPVQTEEAVETPVETEAEERPRPDELALLRPEPTPARPARAEPQPVQPRTTVRPQPARPETYQPQTRTTRIQGGITNRGRAAVDAQATPLGRYKKMLSDAIGSRWYYYVNNDLSLLSIGTVVIRFTVRQDGRVEGIQVLSNTSNETFATCSIRSIMEAEIPPIPEDVASVLDNSRIEVDYTFTIH